MCQLCGSPHPVVVGNARFLVAMTTPLPPDVSRCPEPSESLQKTLTCIANIRPEAVYEPPPLTPTLSLPIIRLQQPTIRHKAKPLQHEKMSLSVEDLTQIGPTPSSPQSIRRPQSRAIMTQRERMTSFPVNCPHQGDLKAQIQVPQPGREGEEGGRGRR